jgi:hypothetical protein
MARRNCTGYGMYAEIGFVFIHAVVKRFLWCTTIDDAKDSSSVTVQMSIDGRIERFRKLATGSS